MLEEVSGEVGIALSDTRIQFNVEDVTLTSKLIDGTFPEYERVIPRDNDKVLRVGKKDFADAVARVAAISSERSRPVKLSLARDLLVLSAASPEQGTATEELDADHVNTNPARWRSVSRPATSTISPTRSPATWSSASPTAPPPPSSGTPPTPAHCMS